MKKIIIAAYILLCICLTGCGGTNQKDYGENYNQEQDAQNFSMIRNAAATENGFYVLQDQYVYFIDKKSKKAVPLCGKPNCKHKDNSCNASGEYSGICRKSLCSSRRFGRINLFFVSNQPGWKPERRIESTVSL